MIKISRPVGLTDEDLEKIEGMEEHSNEWHILDFVDESQLDVYEQTEYPELLRERVNELIENNYPELDDNETLLETLVALIYKIHVLDEDEFVSFVRQDVDVTVLYADEETEVEDARLEFVVKLDDKLDREGITDENGELTVDLFDNVVYAYRVNHDNHLPKEDEFTVQDPYELEIIYVDEDDLGTAEQEELAISGELDIDYLNTLLDVDYSVLDADGEEADDVEVTFSDYAGNDRQVFTDENGELLVVNAFRDGDYYQVDFIDEGEITKTELHISESEAEEVDYGMVKREIELLAGGSIREKEENINIFSELTELQYEEQQE